MFNLFGNHVYLGSERWVRGIVFSFNNVCLNCIRDGRVSPRSSYTVVPGLSYVFWYFVYIL